MGSVVGVQVAGAAAGAGTCQTTADGRRDCWAVYVDVQAAGLQAGASDSFQGAEQSVAAPDREQSSMQLTVANRITMMQRSM